MTAFLIHRFNALLLISPQCAPLENALPFTACMK